MNLQESSDEFSVISGNSCIICTRLADGTLETIAQTCSAKISHELALQEAKKGDPRFTFQELYVLFFSKIYEHEYNRRLTIERERLQIKLRFESENRDKLCSYHSEFSDGFVLQCHKGAEKDYATSKWRAPRLDSR